MKTAHAPSRSHGRRTRIPRAGSPGIDLFTSLQNQDGIADHPLHRSGRAALPHPALALGRDGEAHARIGMTDTWGRKPAGRRRRPCGATSDGCLDSGDARRATRAGPSPPETRSARGRSSGHRSTGCARGRPPADTRLAPERADANAAGARFSPLAASLATACAPSAAAP